LIFIE